MDIFILAFILPASVLILARLFFAFYYPLNIGIYFAETANHTPYQADAETTRKFFIFNSLIFTISFLLLSILIFLPAVAYLYNLPYLLSYFPVTYKYLLISYFVWFMTLIAAGYIFGHGFYDALTYSGIKANFYYISLDQTFLTLKNAPARLIRAFELLFDNEEKVKARMKMHREIAKEYHEKREKEIFKEVLKRGQENLDKMSEARKKKGNLGVFLFNLNHHGLDIVSFPFAPIITFYLIIVDFFVSVSMSSQNKTPEETSDTTK